ncbi:MAG: alpha/beta hydrolase [Lachnospiraceae bacterium]|nr:alpha/beta hydrolase [Lachnospiraceae bacterium]
MRVEEFYFDSRDNQTKIHGIRYMPDTQNVSGVVQIIHGMSEHVARYEEFARFMTERNFVVVGENHLGHGKTVGENGIQGYFCKQDPATVVVRDSHRLKKMTQELYPGVPYFIAGHSMGSFMLRNYMAKYGTGIDGAIIMGTGQMSAGLIAIAKMIVTVQKLFMGGKHPGKLLDNMAFGSCNKRIENPKTSVDWLCSDETVISKYLEDKECGFTFTVNGFETLFELITRAGKKEYIEQIPKELPVFIIAGTKDPIGEYGKAVKKVYEGMKTANIQDVTLKLYEESRHEILNDIEKETVKNDIYHWITAQMAKKSGE